jgi:hypothetical protein
MSASQRADIEAWAVNDLWEATGRVYGTCEVTVMPCNDYSTLCGSCHDAYRSCGCSSVSEVKLAGPVDSITEVVVDGVVLDDTAYRVDDWQWLVRLDGGVWPSSADPTDPDSFSVSYLLGQPPPAGAGTVTGILMCSRSACSNGACRVPKNTQSLTRQGVTMIRNLDGQFGILDVDQWVANANAPMFAGAVHSPDLPTVRQITWEATP